MDAYNRNPNSAAAAAAALMTPTSTSAAMHHHQQHHQQRLPFGSLAPHQPQQQLLHPNPHHQYQHQQQQQQQMDQKTHESMGFEEHAMRFGIEQQHQQAATAKKKRGRPRKYAPDGNIALGLAPTSPLPSASNSFAGGGGDNANSSEPPAKRNRGRPPGSVKRQLDALGGTGGVGFTPHVIEVKTGEDIAMKIRAFSHQGPRAICILSANGSVCTVMLRQATNPNGAVKYEGRYEIISLSGSFMDTEIVGVTKTKTKAGSLSVSLAGPNGQIIGGVVAGTLVAGSQVQVIVGSFVSDGKKQKKSASASRAQNNNSTTTPEPASAPANMLTFGGGGTESPQSQGGVGQNSSESSEENESNSSSHRGNSNNNNNNHGLFGNSMPQSLHPLQMYQLWPGHSPQ